MTLVYLSMSIFYYSGPLKFVVQEDLVLNQPVLSESDCGRS